MHEIKTGHEIKAVPEAEEALIELITEKILDLTTHLGLTETAEMIQLREKALRPMDDAAFTLLLEQYLELLHDQVNSNAERMAFLRAQVGGILLNALMYLSNRRFGEYAEMLEAAADAVPNLGEDQLCDEIDDLFP